MSTINMPWIKSKLMDHSLPFAIYSLRSWWEWVWARNFFAGKPLIPSHTLPASEIPACLISYPFWMPPTFIAFDDEIKLASHRKGDVHVFQTKRLLFVGPLWIFSILVDVYNIWASHRVLPINWRSIGRSPLLANGNSSSLANLLFNRA